jgi:putative membrane protein
MVLKMNWKDEKERAKRMSGRIKETLVVLIQGGIIGVANIIPGVSGGTLAVVLGIYDRLIESLACFFSFPEKRKEYVFFLMKLTLGALGAILLLANLMDFLLTRHFQLTMFAFMGLICGGVPSIWRSHADMRVEKKRALFFLLGILVVLIPSLLGSDTASDAGTAEQASAVVSTWQAYALLFVAGFLAGGGMIVPGVSGSFILVLLGQYAIIIAAIKGLSVLPLLCVSIGAASGILVFSSIIKRCLEKAPAETYYFILGLLAVSFFEIFPGLPSGVLFSVLAFLIFCAGTAASFFMSKLAA